VQEDHDFANDLLVGPGGGNAGGSDSADASDLAQALGSASIVSNTFSPKARTSFLA
jgi:hypothetical protein